jgi:alpha-glucosidase
LVILFEEECTMLSRTIRWWCSAIVAVWALALCPMNASGEPEPGVGERIAGLRVPVTRYWAPYATPEDRVATFALKAPFPGAGTPESPGRITPMFERLDDGRHRVLVAIEPGTSLYGTGMVAGPLLRNGWEIVLWNSDFPGYTVRNQSLYQSHPWVFAVRADGTSFGVLVDTTWRTTLRLDGAIEFISEGRPAPVYIVECDTPQALCTALMELTGPMPLPPRWALGYHQCRWSYFPEARVRQVAAEFRRRRIPASVFWFDIDYMDGFRVFTFDRSRFPNPAGLAADLRRQGWRCVWMIDPGIKDEPGYFVRDQLVGQNLHVRLPDGSAFVGDVWPGPCVFPDYTTPAARRWWAGLYDDFIRNGVDGVWNDMNEPAVFTTATRTMPEDAVHLGGEYRAYPDGPAQTVTPGDHARFHNVYGMLMAQATYEGILAARPDLRPFVLTRASYLGGHRYAATWTGDNSATWTDLEQSIPMILNLGLSGQPFSGPDIGGFIGAGPADLGERAEQFGRWMGIGALFPFARGHTARDNINKEPWEFGPEVERSSRLALQRRYRLLPYIYTLFREASVTGLPVMRPLFFHDPRDPALRSEDDAFLLGSDLLVVPQLLPDGSRTPVVPSSGWRKFDVLSQSHRFNPDLYIRHGAIIPVGPLKEWVDQRPLDPLTLIVALDERGQARGTLYEDDGDGFAYRDGRYLLTTYVASRQERGLVTLRVEKSEGAMERPRRPLIVRVVTDVGSFEGRGIDGEEVRLFVR